MKKKEIVVEIICFLYIVLFVYAAASKLMDVEKFRVQIGQSPLLTLYASIIAWAIPLLEIIIAVLLSIKSLRPIALYLALSLMVMFTTYIFIIMNFSEYIPCSCGGVLQKLGWREHLFFNLVFTAMGSLAIFLLPQKNPTDTNKTKKISLQQI